MPNQPHPPRLVGWSCRLYALLTHAYSPAFRAVYGGEMVRVFGDCCLAAHQQEGNGGLIVVWARALMDLLSNAPAERVQTLLRDAGTRRLLVALGPVALLLGGVVCWSDVSSGKVGASVLLLLLFTAVLGFAHPRLAGLWALVVGACVPAVHALARLRDWQLPYPTNAWTPLFALLALLPALCGAGVGAACRRFVNHVRTSLRRPAAVLVFGVLLLASFYQGVWVLDLKPETRVARLRHDPWQSLVRDMDQTLAVFRKANLYSDEWSGVGNKILTWRPSGH